jgi:hypothetical protein
MYSQTKAIHHSWEGFGWLAAAGYLELWTLPNMNTVDSGT